MGVMRLLIDAYAELNLNNKVRYTDKLYVVGYLCKPKQNLTNNIKDMREMWLLTDVYAERKLIHGAVHGYLCSWAQIYN